MSHPVVVLAGGIGTRVAHITGPDRPKVMLRVAGRPFIDFKLGGLALAGITEVYLLVGHGADAIRSHVGDGSRFGLRVDYALDGGHLLGTGGAVRAALGLLPDRFWVTYGDTLLDVPIRQVEQDFVARGLIGLMTVLENSDRWEPSNVDVAKGLVTVYEKVSGPGTHRFIDYGMLLIRASGFEAFPARAPFDLGAVLRALVERGALGAYEVTSRFWHVGTEEAWRETDRHLREPGLFPGAVANVPTDHKGERAS